jgi:hypothetical protein
VVDEWLYVVLHPISSMTTSEHNDSVEGAREGIEVSIMS